MGTTATSSQVHEASVCVSFCFCRCLCMHPCTWLNSTRFHFIEFFFTVQTSFGVLCRVFHFTCACMCTCAPYSLQSSPLACLCISCSAAKKRSGFPTTEFSLQKCFPISVIHRWCPRTQQASTFPINGETTHSFHQRLHD